MNPLFQAMRGAPAMKPWQDVLKRARQIAGSFQNPQQMIQQMIPGIPLNIQNDPNQIIQWLQQTGRVSPQAVQMAQSLMGSPM